MRKKNRRFDIVYIKSGDVIAHLARIDTANEVDRHSGPDAFLSDFLRVTQENSVLLISRGKTSKSLKYRPNIEARTIRKGSTRITSLLAKPLMMIRIFYYLKRSRPQWLLCGANQECLWISFIYSKLWRVPLVHSRHNRISMGAGTFFRRLSTALDKACIRRITGVICHGPYLKQELQDMGLLPSKIQEFDVDLSAFRANLPTHVADKASSLEGEVIVLYIGRMEPLKGIFDLLDALEPRLQQDKRVKLLYAGQGDASFELAQTIKDRGLASQVKLMGRIPHHELATLMSRCKMVVTPTRKRFAEGRCMVAMESLALGIPVVAPNFGPFPFLIEHETNGLLFTPDSVADLAAKLHSMLDDDSLYTKVRAGARRSSNALLVPPLTFAQAVIRGFNVTASNLGKGLLQDS